MPQSLSGPLQAGIRFFLHPIPALPTTSLAVGLPSGREYGLTVFRVSDNGRLGVGILPVCLCPRVIRGEDHIRTHTILVRASQHLWLITHYEIYHRFTSVHRTSKPSALPLDASSSASLSRDPLQPFGVGYIVGMASNLTVTSHACTPRLLPEER
jgi:hypothetical protein